MRCNYLLIIWQKCAIYPINNPLHVVIIEIGLIAIYVLKSDIAGISAIQFTSLFIIVAASSAFTVKKNCPANQFFQLKTSFTQPAWSYPPANFRLSRGRVFIPVTPTRERTHGILSIAKYKRYPSFLFLFIIVSIKQDC